MEVAELPNRNMLFVAGLMTIAVASHDAARADAHSIPLKAHTTLDTFYVTIGVAGGRTEDYLVDTGAGYMTITASTLQELQASGSATRIGQLDGRMADGTTLRVPVYRLEEITIGTSCRFRDVEAAVLPGASRGLFGLSALRKASPFEFSVDPPILRLSNCMLSAAEVPAPAAR